VNIPIVFKSNDAIPSKAIQRPPDVPVIENTREITSSDFEDQGSGEGDEESNCLFLSSGSAGLAGVKRSDGECGSGGCRENTIETWSVKKGWFEM